MEALWDEAKAGVQLAFRFLVPPLEDRIPMTVKNGIIHWLCYIPLFFLAYLARRPNTYPIRLLLFPITIVASFYAAHHFTWTDPKFNVNNWGQSVMAVVASGKALEYGLTKEGMLKLGESEPGVVKGKDKTGDSTERNGNVSNGNGVHSPPETKPKFLKDYVPAWFADPFELLHTSRGLSFKFGQGTYLPPLTRPLTSRSAFLKATLRYFIIAYLLLDLFESTVKSFPGGIGTPQGGSIFYPQLAPYPRFLVSTLLNILTGYGILAGFAMVHSLITLVAVGIIGDSPTAWPPVIDRGWTAESMHHLWARGWHQTLRQTFLVYGGYPGKWAFKFIATVILAPWVFVNPSKKRVARAIAVQFGGLGMLLGAFLASGLFHECTITFGMNRGWDWAPVLYFASQGPILVGERLWRVVTGRKVGGWLGTFWFFFCFYVMAQPMADSWNRRGLGGGAILPPILSPMRVLVIPMIEQIMKLFASF